MKQKLSYIALLWFSISYLTAHAQSNIENGCASQLKEAYHLLSKRERNPEDISQGLSQVKSCADSGNAEAQFTYGYLFLKGIVVPQDYNIAFTYFEKSAKQDYPQAITELAELYKDGNGCKLDFNKALTLFEKAYDIGEQKAGFKIGYMYFKGLGSVTQSYAKAIEWFEKSDYPMSEHFLGICNYFGFGTAVDKAKGTAYFEGNPTQNSKVLLYHLESHPDIVNIGTEKEKSVNASEFTESKIREVVIEEPTSTNPSNEIVYASKSLIQGDWKGKLIELDWAQEKMLRSFPINLSIGANLEYRISIAEQNKANTGVYANESYLFKDLDISLPRLYQDDEDEFEINYNLLAIHNIEVKEIDNIPYLTAFVEGYNKNWSEPMQPMLLVLGNAKALTDNGKEIDPSLIQALANLEKDNFILTYPNPFQSDLLVQYDLEDKSITSVSIYNLTGDFIQTIVQGETQEPGKHLYHIDSTQFSNGLYVVKVQANNTIYTKLIIKK